MQLFSLNSYTPTCFHNYLGHHIPTWSVLHLPVPTLNSAMRLFNTWASALRFLCHILHSLLGSEQFIHNQLSLAHSLRCKVLSEFWQCIISCIHHALSFRIFSYPQISCIPCSPIPLSPQIPGNHWLFLKKKKLFIVLPFPQISIIGII